MMLIVDEAHRALAHRSVSSMGVFDFLRELWNRKKCAICLSMTDEGRDAFQKGPGAKALQQLWRRRIAPLQLPPFPPDDDAGLFAQAYGLPPAGDEPVSAKVSFIDTSSRTRTKTLSDSPLRLQRHVLATEGLGVWVTILQDAADMAHDLQKPITWGAVLKAHAQSLADGEMLQ